MKTLIPFNTDLSTLKAQMYYVASKKPEYQIFVDELTKMNVGLDNYFAGGQVLLAQSEDMTIDTPDDALEKQKVKVVECVSQGEHHIIGAKAAKARYNAIVDAK